MAFVVFAGILGIIQGLAEFLPISSSGHLALFQSFFSDYLSQISDITAFNVLLHLGTLLAVFVVYRKDLKELIPACFTLLGKWFRGKFKVKEYNENEKTVFLLFIATLPLVFLKIFDILLSAFFEFSLLDSMELYITRQPIAVGLILIFNGFLLYFSDRLVYKEKSLSKFNCKNALTVGIFQMFAILPGLSRSGSTITGGRMNGLGRTSAVRFSFLLSVPAILGSAVTELPSLFEKNAFDATVWVGMLIGTVLSFVVGLLSMKLLQYIAKTSSFKGFSYYSFAVGALAVVGGVVLLLL